jgi:hypothetical protein
MTAFSVVVDQLVAQLALHHATGFLKQSRAVHIDLLIPGILPEPERCLHGSNVAAGGWIVSTIRRR